MVAFTIIILVVIFFIIVSAFIELLSYVCGSVGNIILLVKNKDGHFTPSESKKFKIELLKAIIYLFGFIGFIVSVICTFAK